MRVLLDGQPLLGSRTGIGRYVSSLLSCLNEPQDIEVFLAFNRIFKNVDAGHILPDYRVHNNRFPYKVIRRLMKPNGLYEYPFDFFSKEKYDLFHGTNFTIMPTARAKNVVTIHDLAYMIYPESTSDKIYRHHTTWVPYSVEKADRIIADSFQTKLDLIKLLHVPEEKIDVVHLAGDPIFRVMHYSEYEQIVYRYGLPKQYILYVGTVEPRKNLITLIKAFHHLKQQSNCRQKLVIVGAKGWKYSSIFELIQEFEMESDVLFTGYVSDDDLVGIYNGATCFVLPSIYEGFGLPLLEAMQCGIPVIGSNVSSIPEVVGEAGMLINPHDVSAWTEALATVVFDSHYRQELADLALDRAKHFSWDKAAAQTIDVYRKALKEGNR